MSKILSERQILNLTDSLYNQLRSKELYGMEPNRLVITRGLFQQWTYYLITLNNGLCYGIDSFHNKAFLNKPITIIEGEVEHEIAYWGYDQ